MPTNLQRGARPPWGGGGGAHLSSPTLYRMVPTSRASPTLKMKRVPAGSDPVVRGARKPPWAHGLSTVASVHRKAATPGTQPIPRADGHQRTVVRDIAPVGLLKPARSVERYREVRSASSRARCSAFSASRRLKLGCRSFLKLVLTVCRAQKSAEGQGGRLSREMKQGKPPPPPPLQGGWGRRGRTSTGTW